MSEMPRVLNGTLIQPAGRPRCESCDDELRPGDRISIGSGTKGVAEALREAGVPVRLRSRWPVVEERGRIAWVVGVRVAPATAGISTSGQDPAKEFVLWCSASQTRVMPRRSASRARRMLSATAVAAVLPVLTGDWSTRPSLRIGLVIRGA